MCVALLQSQRGLDAGEVPSLAFGRATSENTEVQGRLRCLEFWVGRVRTSECRIQRPVPYHLATTQLRLPLSFYRALLFVATAFACCTRGGMVASLRACLPMATYPFIYASPAFKERLFETHKMSGAVTDTLWPAPDSTGELPISPGGIGSSLQEISKSPREIGISPRKIGSSLAEIPIS